ncbi:MAG TPA: arylsulfotransferase family protein [Planctomycetota bacterium]
MASFQPVRAAGRHGRSALFLLLPALAACGDGPADPDPGAAALRPGAVPPTEDLSTLDDLAHLGYVDYAEPDSEGASGVVLRDPARADGGYTLVTSLTTASAALVDAAGREVRTWSEGAGPEARWARVRLLANGDLLCVSPRPDALTRLGFDGTRLWRLPIEAHHDGIELPDGRLLVLTRAFRTLPAVDPARRSVDNHLTFVSADGRVLEERSLYDLLAAEPRQLVVRRPAGLEELPPGYDLDPIHANTLFWLAQPLPPGAHPEFRPGRLLVTLRYLDAVALLDLEQGRCVWSFGPGLLEGPHDASVLPDGRVLVLDNGWDARGWSRVVEYDPVQERVTWEYRAEVPERFHTSGRGTVQRLPEGNVLVGNSNSGEAFEVTREGRLVWRYLNPRTDPAGARAVVRVERYPAARIEPLLARFPDR